MASIDFIHGYNRAASTANILLAIYGNDVVNVDTGLGYNRNLLSPDLASMETFLDYTFLQDYNVRPSTFNGTAWGVTNVGRTPLAKHQKRVKTRMYLAYCKLGAPDAITTAGPWPSRVFKSDLPDKDQLTWGIEWGSNLTTTANSTIVTLSNSVQDFKATNIKVGDPFFVVSPFTFRSFVSSVDSRYRITLTDAVPSAAAGNAQFWVGSNWFDLATDDNDYITGLGENNNKLLGFKQFSLWTYDDVSPAKRIKDAVGTNSRKSIVNRKGYTFYFHGSNPVNRRTGIYLFDGYKSTFISRAIQDYMNAIDPDFYSKVVAWPEGNRVRMFIGDLDDLSLTKMVATYDVDGGQWSIDPLSDTIASAGKYLEGGEEKYFLGSNGGEVFEAQEGNSFDGDTIPFAVETGVRYPSGSSIVNKLSRIHVLSKNGTGLRVSYKLVGTPFDNDDVWQTLGDMEHTQQEFYLPVMHNKARGINTKIQDISGNVNNFVVRKITIFYEPMSLRSKV